MEQPVLSFRSSVWWTFWPIWRWGMFLGAVLALGSITAWGRRGFGFGWEDHLLFALVGGLAGGLFSALWVVLVMVPVAAYFLLYVATDGLKCYDAFGIYHFAPWETIERVKPINLL